MLHVQPYLPLAFQAMHYALMGPFGVTIVPQRKHASSLLQKLRRAAMLLHVITFNQCSILPASNLSKPSALCMRTATRLSTSEGFRHTHCRMLSQVPSLYLSCSGCDNA